MNAEINSHQKGRGICLGSPMKGMLLLVLVVIGIGTLLGTTATPVMI